MRKYFIFFVFYLFCFEKIIANKEIDIYKIKMPFILKIKNQNTYTYILPIS
jgi:hypothetical protein